MSLHSNERAATRHNAQASSIGRTAVHHRTMIALLRSCRPLGYFENELIVPLLVPLYHKLTQPVNQALCPFTVGEKRTRIVVLACG